MTMTIERPRLTLPQAQREKFLKIESARATARAVWNAYAYGWRVAPSLAVKTDGRTTEKASSPASGARYSEWKQPTAGGRLEVIVYETDLYAELVPLRCLISNDFDNFVNCQRYSIPSTALLERLFTPLSFTACNFVALAT